MDLYLKTRSGYLLRAVGSNELLVTSLAKDKGNVKILGLGISNGLVALSGSVFCQQQGVFDISSGTGAMVIGLASVIVGTSLFQLFTRVFKKRFGGFSKLLPLFLQEQSCIRPAQEWRFGTLNQRQ